MKKSILYSGSTTSEEKNDRSQPIHSQQDEATDFAIDSKYETTKINVCGVVKLPTFNSMA